MYHAGTIGKDGGLLEQVLQDAGANTRYLRQVDEPTGNAIIQVDAKAQNCIVLYAGANQLQTSEVIHQVISGFGAGDLLLIQNEINLVDVLIDAAFEHGMKIALNPSPYNVAMEACDLSKISPFILNEVEGMQLTGEKDPDRILSELIRNYPSAGIVLTLGSKGSFYKDQNIEIWQTAYDVKPVDTTAAGDTFTGYFLAAQLQGKSPKEALKMAAVAASIAVCRKGASVSIPTLQEVEDRVTAYSRIYL